MMKNIKDMINKVQFLGFLFILLLSSILFPTSPSKIYAATSDQKVYDYGELFTEDEVDELEQACKEYGEKGQLDIVIITTNDLKGRSSRQEFLEDFYDEYGFGYDKEYGDSALILINMEPGNRGVEIQGYGKAEYYLNYDRIDLILENIVNDLTDGKYYQAVTEFIEAVEYYSHEEVSSPNKSNPSTHQKVDLYPGAKPIQVETRNRADSILYNTFFQLILALIIGGVSVGIMAGNAGGRITTHNRTYLDERNSRVVASRDDYIRTTTTRVRKPTNNNNNSGGGKSSFGGGTSKGGHSHSGGGRSF